VQVIEIGPAELSTRLSLAKIDWQALRFFLNGPHQHVFHLYELLFNHVCHIECEVQAPDGERAVMEF
jgi:type VI protein secretion system component VasA